MYRQIEIPQQLTDLSDVKYLQISPALLDDFFLTAVKVPKIAFDNSQMSKEEYFAVISQFRSHGYDIVKETPEYETVLLYTSGKILKPFHILIIAYDMNDPDKWECGRNALALYEYLDKYLIDPYNQSKIIVKKCAHIINHQDATRIFDFKKGPDLIIGQQFATTHAYKLATDLKCMYIPIIYNNMGENMAVAFPYGLWSWEGKFVDSGSVGLDCKINLQRGNFADVQWDALWDLVNFKISVIVPCHGRHINFLPQLLNNLREMTRQPYEIVISISIPKDEKISDYIVVIESCKNVQLHISSIPLTAAQNRNLAANCSKGDILVSLDADDLYNPQLLEVIYYTWKRFPDTKEFHWAYRLNEVQNKKIILPELKYFKSTHNYPKGLAEKYFIYDKIEYLDMVHGHGAYSKELWNEIKWPEIICGEDVSHNKQIIIKYPDQSIFIWEPLTFYYIKNSIGLTNF